MPGLLQYGAMAGVGGEWLKQSGERRANEYQKIRDNRLSELRKGELKYGSELATTEAMRKEKVEAGAAGLQREHETGLASAEQKSKADISEAEQKAATERAEIGNRYQSVPASAGLFDTEKDELAHSQGHKPTAGTAANDPNNPKNRGVRLNNEAKTPIKVNDLKEMYKLKYMVETEDIFTNEKKWVPKEGAPELFDWINSTIIPEDRTIVLDPALHQKDPDMLYRIFTEMDPQAKQPGAIEAYVNQVILPRFPKWRPPGATAPSPAPPGPNPAAPIGGADYLARSSQAPTSGATPQSANEFAGLVTPGATGMLSQGQEIQTRQTSDSTFSGHIMRKITELERELNALEGKGGPGVNARRKALMQEIESQKRLLGGQ